MGEGVARVFEASEKRQLVREVEKKMIVDQLHKGTAAIEEIARGLNVSSKTLEEDSSWRLCSWSDLRAPLAQPATPTLA